MKNLPIRLKLVSIYVNMSLFTLFIFFVSLSTMQTLSKDQNYIGEVTLGGTQHILKLESILTQDQVYSRDALLNHNDKTQLEQAIASMQSTQETFEENLNIYAGLIKADDIEGTQLYDGIKSAYLNSYIPLRDKFITSVKVGNIAQAQSLLDDMQTNSTTVLDSVSKVVAHNNIIAQSTATKGDKMVERMYIFFPILTVIYVLVTFALGRYLAKQIAHPASILAETAKKISQGSVNVTLDYTSKDEMGVLTEEFRKMVTAIKKQAEILQLVAQGDYRMSVEIRSKDDVVNKAIALMLDNNNQLISEIYSASAQVSIGSQQIAQGAQNLAAGSSQQASSIEQFSAATHQVMEKSEKNTLTAQKALSLTESGGEKMGEGISSMGKVQSAMHAIDVSSKDITRVIKVIDDIAFQTNILALNAAVEAARAGQHGKGFAVVADEVRNLAAKSAAAARETTTLIQGSIDKVKEGNKIVERTSENLTIVGEFAQVTANLNNQIAAASEEQSVALTQLTQGIAEVSSVVQMNSSTAEQAAAAAEEMSAQAALLTSIVSKFKLRESFVNNNTQSGAKLNYISEDSNAFSMSAASNKY